MIRARKSPTTALLRAYRAENLAGDLVHEMERTLDLLRAGEAAAAIRRLETALDVPRQAPKLRIVAGGGA